MARPHRLYIRGQIIILWVKNLIVPTDTFLQVRTLVYLVDILGVWIAVRMS
jgi:hypothetical protein